MVQPPVYQADTYSRPEGAQEKGHEAAFQRPFRTQTSTRILSRWLHHRLISRCPFGTQIRKHFLEGYITVSHTTLLKLIA